MTTIFIGGSRRVTRLNSLVCARLENVIERGHRVLIGDANGADRAVQQFFADRHYQEVVVYCMENRWRNNVGNWPSCSVQGGGQKGFAYYSLKDEAMTRDADCGFMLWDGRSRGTFMNIRRLVDAGKPTAVYIAPSQEFINARTRQDLAELLNRSVSPERRQLAELLAEPPVQLSLHVGGDWRYEHGHRLSK